jgi:hypothetical protein
MNILIITGDYFPIKSPRSLRATELSKELIVQGHKVDVLTHKDIEFQKEFENKFGIEIINFQFKKWQTYLGKTCIGNLLIKIISRIYLFHYYFLVRQSFDKLKKYDAVITVSVPFPIAWGLASFSKKKIKDKFGVWIADLGDPFMLNKGLKSKPFFLFHYFEWNMLYKADYVTIPFEEMKSQFYNRFHKKLYVVPQGVPMGVPISIYKEIKPLKIGFSGYIYRGSRDVFSLIDYLISQDYDFEFHIYTNQRELFAPYNKFIGKQLLLFDYVDREKLILELSKLDFLVAVNFDSFNNQITAYPSKLIDYALSKRPILMYENSRLPLKVIEEFMNYNFINKTIVNIEKYNIKTVAKQFIQLILS